MRHHVISMLGPRAIPLLTATVCALLLFLGLAWGDSRHVAQGQTTTPAATASATGPYTVTVQAGDSWSSIARRTGLSVRQLQAANPSSVRETGWLLNGEILVIPASGAAQPTATNLPERPRTYVVQAGESWNSIAQTFGLTASELQEANPRSVRAGLVLYRNEELNIPATEVATPETPPVTPAAAGGATATPAETPTGTPVETPAPASADEALAVTETDTSTVEAEAGTTPAPATDEPAKESTLPACPAVFAGYPRLLADLINSPLGGSEGILGFLRQCDAVDEENIATGDWTGDGADDLAVVIVNQQSDAVAPETDLLIFVSEGERYSLAYRARAAGQVRLLATEDINDDGKPDLAWVDNTCGTSTCFDTVNVRSWDGSGWRDWTDGTITMAYAEIELGDVRDTAQGQEFQLQGGDYGTAGAGPQRGRTEVWGSIAGAPYQLLDKVYDRSTCLYHKVLDANEALERYQEVGLVQAKEMYTEAVTNRNLTQCSERAGELQELRSFSLFRLALVSAYEGEAEAAAENIAQLQEAFPDSLFAPFGQAWLDAYQSSGGDVAAACDAATRFATDNPETYESLSDYGYANPTFQPEDLCPRLAIEPLPTDITRPTTTPTAAPPVEEAANATPAAVAPEIAGQQGELPDCPANLDAYGEVMPQVMQITGGDTLIVETWLRLCDGMADDRGGMLLGDFNGDGVDDALFLPTIVSDLGFGPDGTQGAVLLYHGQEDGSYTLAFSPEVYGQPTVLNMGDVNGDGQLDLAWTIEGCSTFCVKEVQVLTWDAEAAGYVSIIDPGATIAEGAARFEDLPEGAPGQGRQLVLEGGVSGTTDGGLEVAHSEIWQSVEGQNFRRLSWNYDRDTPGNDCLGLRLIEADAALQASDILGYGPAVELYTASMDPALRACSIYGVPANAELQILRGLDSFRLIQTQALSGTLDKAKETLASLAESQPEGPYTAAATQWLAEFERSGDAKTACVAVQPIFDRETATWQITDHFGFNHPALAMEQICFVPRGE